MKAPELPTLSPSSRVRILDFPVAPPGKCVICGHPGGEGRKFIDIGFDLDFYGVIYFCDCCIVQIINGLGLASPEQYKELSDAYKELEDLVGRTEIENVKLRNALSSVDFLGTTVSDSSAPEPTVQTISEEGSTSPKIDGPTSGGGRTNSARSTESRDITDLV